MNVNEILVIHSAGLVGPRFRFMTTILAGQSFSASYSIISKLFSFLLLNITNVKKDSK